MLMTSNGRGACLRKTHDISSSARLHETKVLGKGAENYHVTDQPLPTIYQESHF